MIGIHLRPEYSPSRVFASEAGRFRCLSPLALRVGGNVDADAGLNQIILRVR